MPDTSGVVRPTEVLDCSNVLLAGRAAVAAVQADLGVVSIPDACELHPGDDVGLLAILPTRVVPGNLGWGRDTQQDRNRNWCSNNPPHPTAIVAFLSFLKFFE